VTTKILWIASYPKSGNTWIRSIISSLFYTKKGDFNFNLLNLIELFEQKKNFNFVNNINQEDYKNLHKIEIISKYWLEAQNSIINQRHSINPIYNVFKTHNANLFVNSNIFTKSDYTAGIIYLVRDPREIAISYSKHMGKGIDQTIDIMLNEKTTLKPPNDFPTSIISTWELHYKSWKKTNAPKLILKYEDMIENTKETIERIIVFLCIIFQIKKDSFEKKINNIINSTNINKFRQHELKFGFAESSNKSYFFGNAKRDSWKKILSKKQVKKIEDKFYNTMREIGYI
tara:strand:- start:2691 stop:3551 length:861 start_codon:yes stop_codon:yes gene_type:complete